MMQDPITDAGFVNLTRFGIGYVKCMIGAMSIPFTLQIIVQLLYVIPQVIVETLNINFPCLVSQKFFPGSEQVFV